MSRLAEISLWAAYLAPAALLMLFGFNLLFLLVLFVRRRRGVAEEVAGIYRAFRGNGGEASLPEVVTQLPVYNECNVVERAMRAIAAMDYPAGRHLLQVLDDSDDPTRDIVDQVAAELRAGGARVEVVRRGHRLGFKAGALREGMDRSGAAFFAIFDADFVPPRDFLLRTLPVLLVRPEVGLVQARWGHLNAGASLVTRAQGIGIDGHFAVEQPARAWNNLFMNFNGTAGVWRRRAIEDAGGWQHDTLTEDMDLSYRAQLAGWKPYYLADLVVPAELPESINAFKSQQFRWAKGSIQTAIKLLPRILRSRASALAKAQAVLHMTHYATHPIMVWLALCTLPLLFSAGLRDHPLPATVLFALIILSALAPAALYAASQTCLYPGRRLRDRLGHLPVLACLGVGIALSNSRAVIEAVLGRRSEFVRTPKRGDRPVVRYAARLPRVALLELALGAYCFFTLWFYAVHRTFIVWPFLLLCALGFTFVGLLSIAHSLCEGRWLRGPHPG